MTQSTRPTTVQRKSSPLDLQHNILNKSRSSRIEGHLFSLCPSFFFIPRPEPSFCFSPFLLLSVSHGDDVEVDATVRGDSHLCSAQKPLSSHNLTNEGNHFAKPIINLLSLTPFLSQRNCGGTNAGIPEGLPAGDRLMLPQRRLWPRWRG